MDINQRAEYAAKLDLSGKYNCCQAVLAALASETNYSEEELYALGSGFGLGMGNMQGTCGALVGAIMILSIKMNGQPSGKYSRAIVEEFNRLCGAVTCKDLKARVDGKPLCPCTECVKNAVLAYGKVMGLN